MSIYSMTGYGKSEAELDNFVVSIEIKSVNHRFLDMRFKMSSLFSDIELDLRNKLKNNFKRGSFDIYINYKKSNNETKIENLDFDKVESFITSFKKIDEKTGVPITFRPTDFLRSEFYKEQDENELENLKKITSQAFEGALDDLKESRKVEGSKLNKILLGHKKKYEEYFSKIENLASSYKEDVEAKLIKRAESFSKDLNIDEGRMLQEVIYYLEKLDVHEEINRIKTHLEKLESLLTSEEEVGRQLDFLIQELNRETNTIGSKSSKAEISECVVQMKVQLEKIREQGLNIE